MKVCFQLIIDRKVVKHILHVGLCWLKITDNSKDRMKCNKYLNTQVQM